MLYTLRTIIHRESDVCGTPGDMNMNIDTDISQEYPEDMTPPKKEHLVLSREGKICTDS